VIEYRTDTAEIHFRYSNPNLNSIREPLKPEEAWFNLQSRMLRVTKPLKDYLSMFPEGILPQGSPYQRIPDKDLGKEKDLEDSNEDNIIPLEELDEPLYEPPNEPAEFDGTMTVSIPVTSQPNWLQTISQASHTPVVHNDEQVQKLRKEQSTRSTNGTVYLLFLLLSGLAIWLAFSPILARRIRRRVMQ
jgi:hypothetical protein